MTSQSKHEDQKKPEKKGDQAAQEKQAAAPKGPHKGEPSQPAGTPEVHLPGG